MKDVSGIARKVESMMMNKQINQEKPSISGVAVKPPLKKNVNS